MWGVFCKLCMVCELGKAILLACLLDVMLCYAVLCCLVLSCAVLLLGRGSCEPPRYLWKSTLNSYRDREKTWKVGLWNSAVEVGRMSARMWISVASDCFADCDDLLWGIMRDVFASCYDLLQRMMDVLLWEIGDKLQWWGFSMISPAAAKQSVVGMIRDVALRKIADKLRWWGSSMFLPAAAICRSEWWEMYRLWEIADLNRLHLLASDL